MVLGARIAWTQVTTPQGSMTPTLLSSYNALPLKDIH